MTAAVLPRFDDCWIVLAAGATAATGRGAGSAATFCTNLAGAGLLTKPVTLPSEPTNGTPSLAAKASYSLPSKLASKNFLNHWTNSKLSWNLALTNFSTGIIFKYN